MLQKKINYPTRKNNMQTSNTNRLPQCGNRGMSLEMLLNQANEFYVGQAIASIHKKPTPIQVVNVDNRSRAAARITEAYYTVPSTTDYNGVYKGYHIDFEAKQTNLLSLPYHNFHEHQIEHMKLVKKQQGLCFVIIYFKKKDRFFMLDAEKIINWYENSRKDDTARKSISIEMAENNGHEIDTSRFPTLDYIPIIDKYISGGSVNEQK